LPEASGLAASQRTDQLFWSHNDSASPEIVAVGADGTSRGRVRLAGASIEDWEAVSTAPCESGSCLYVGDIGDNERARRRIVVYRTPEPAPGEATTADAQIIEGVYPEGPQDAEALFVLDGDLFVVTKGEGTPIRLYRFPSATPGSHTLQVVATLTDAGADKTFRITDAAVSPDERWLALRTNDLLLFYDAQRVRAGTPGTPLSYDLRSLGEPQGEGVAWADAQTLFLAGESSSGGTFARVTCPKLNP
jgi:hypothetical protein